MLTELSSCCHQVKFKINVLNIPAIIKEFQKSFFIDKSYLYNEAFIYYTTY